MVYDPVKRKERYEKNKEKQQEYYEKNKEQIKYKKKEYHEKNKEKKNDSDKKRREDLKQHACDSIILGEIIDRHKWDIWCDKIKSDASKHPYSDDFTNDIIFDMMNQGCFYCGDVATTIDRVDSKLEHTIYNCVGCCWGCNNSKGATDSSSFVRKAYYRARGEYYDTNDDIWFVNETKPGIYQYQYKAKKKRVPFELTHEYFYTLTKGDCAYCHRSPSTWFGIDKIVPSLGYVIGNVASCCYDCNVDKLDDDVDITMMRNERIAKRVDTGDLVIVDCEKVILHTGTRKSSKIFN
jgi:hypothetical protein